MPGYARHGLVLKCMTMCRKSASGRSYIGVLLNTPRRRRDHTSAPDPSEGAPATAAQTVGSPHPHPHSAPVRENRGGRSQEDGSSPEPPNVYIQAQQHPLAAGFRPGAGR